MGKGKFGAGLMVYFGTGKFLEPADRVIANLYPQTFYGLQDNNAIASTDLIPNRTSLTQQTIDVETTVTVGTKTNGVRVLSNNAIGTNRGWYLDLISPGNTFRGEMQVTDSVLVWPGSEIGTDNPKAPRPSSVARALVRVPPWFARSSSVKMNLSRPGMLCQPRPRVTSAVTLAPVMGAPYR